MNKAQKTLPSLLTHLEGTELTVELKTGRQFRGILVSADLSMDLTLERATSSDNNISLSLVHIRGSTIRYIHFPSQLDISLKIKQGLDRYVHAANDVLTVNRLRATSSYLALFLRYRQLTTSSVSVPERLLRNTNAEYASPKLDGLLEIGVLFTRSFDCSQLSSL